MQELRESAFQRFAELGFPTTHDEEWRFTNVAPIARAHVRECARHGKRSRTRPPRRKPGRRGEVSRQVGFVRRQRFRRLNTAFLEDVAVIQVPHGAMIEKPIRIDYTAAEAAHAAPRTLIVVGADAHCTIVESYSGTGRYFTNAVTEIVAGDRAVVDHYKVQREVAGGLPRRHHAGATGPQREFHHALHLARRRAGAQRCQRGALRRHGGHA